MSSNVWHKFNSTISFLLEYFADKRISGGKVAFYKSLFREMPFDGEEKFKEFFKGFLGKDVAFDEAYKEVYG